MWQIKVACCRQCFGPMGYKYLTRTFLTELEAEQFAAMFVEVNGKLHHKKWTVSLEFDTLADHPVELHADKVVARSPLKDRQFTGVPRIKYVKRPKAPKALTYSEQWDDLCGNHCSCAGDECMR